MTVHWTFLFLALLLLLPPLPLSAATRKYVLSLRRNSSASVQSMAACWQNWADLLRAAAGSYVLSKLAIEVTPGLKGVNTKVLVLEGLVLGTGVLCQMVRVGRGVQLLAPSFYLCGITLIMAGFVQGGFAVFVGWLFAIGGQRPAYELPIMGVALGVGGYVLDSTLTLPLILACSLIFLPLLLAFLFQKPLAFVAKEWLPSETPTDS